MDDHKYNTITEKENFFLHEKVTSIEELNLLVGRLMDNTFLNPVTDKCQCRYLFRGVCDAGYYMQTSLQVHWKLDHIDEFLPNVSQKMFLSIMMARMVNNPMIKEWLTNNKVTISALSLLALMQHYGIPSPLLDWTPNIKYALNFAKDGMSTEIHSKDETSSFVSLYYIDMQKNYEFAETTCQNIIENGIESIEELLSMLPKDISPILDLSNAHLDKLLNLDTVLLDLLYISHSTDAPYVKDYFGAILNVQNKNMDLQEGAFVSNGVDTIPMEVKWNNKLEQQYPSGVILKEKIHCVDIHKSVISEWWSKPNNQVQLYDQSNDSMTLRREMTSEYYKLLLSNFTDDVFTLFKTLFIDNNPNSVTQLIAEKLVSEL